MRLTKTAYAGWLGHASVSLLVLAAFRCLIMSITQCNSKSFQTHFSTHFFWSRKKGCPICNFLCLILFLAKIRMSLESHRLSTKFSPSNIYCFSYQQTMYNFCNFVLVLAICQKRALRWRMGFWVAILKCIWDMQALLFVSNSRGVQCRACTCESSYWEVPPLLPESAPVTWEIYTFPNGKGVGIELRPT